MVRVGLSMHWRFGFNERLREETDRSGGSSFNGVLPSIRMASKAPGEILFLQRAFNNSMGHGESAFEDWRKALAGEARSFLDC